MELVGYISECHDHKYICVTQFKPTEQNKEITVRKIYTASDEVYSKAVKCHSNGVPAVLNVDLKKKYAWFMVTTDITPLTIRDKTND